MNFSVPSSIKITELIPEAATQSPRHGTTTTVLDPLNCMFWMISRIVLSLHSGLSVTLVEVYTTKNGLVVPILLDRTVSEN